LILPSWLFLAWCVLCLMWALTDAQLGKVASFIQISVGQVALPLASWLIW
jgi:hypothetical protein